jgi:hypothetical protein
MAAEIGRFSKVAWIRVRADRGSWAICDGLLSGVTPRKRTSVRRPRNPVLSWHTKHGRAGWRLVCQIRDGERLTYEPARFGAPRRGQATSRCR